MSKFHINKHGVPAPCKAKPGNCPLGGEGEHFDTPEAAQKFIDSVNEAKHDLLPPISRKIGPQMAIIRGSIDPEKLTEVTGNPGINKPDTGGFWTSTRGDDGESGWTKYTRKRMFYRKEKKRVTWDIAEIEVSDEANILTIDSEEDFNRIIEQYRTPKDKYKNRDKPYFHLSTAIPSEDLLDFDMLKEDYDAINVTENGLKENKVALKYWDCESTLWFNVDKFEDVQYVEKGYKEKNLFR